MSDHPYYPIVFKICAADEWQKAKDEEQYQGSETDRQDGFIHLSLPAQVAETAYRHFGGVEGLMLISIVTFELDIRYEKSRDGTVFPHLYGSLPMKKVAYELPLLLGDDGLHRFPPDINKYTPDS